MAIQFIQNKYNPGDVVSAKENPTLNLVIRRYIEQVYYCNVQDDPERKELVYFDWELVENKSLEAKNKREREENDCINKLQI